MNFINNHGLGLRIIMSDLMFNLIAKEYDINFVKFYSSSYCLKTWENVGKRGKT